MCCKLTVGNGSIVLLDIQEYNFLVVSIAYKIPSCNLSIPKIVDVLQIMSLTIFLSGIFALTILLVLTSSRHLRFPEIPRVGKKAGFWDFTRIAVKREFVLNGHHLVDEGYKKVRSHCIFKISRIKQADQMLHSIKMSPSLSRLRIWNA